MAMTNVARAALWYAKHGWAVLPLQALTEGRCTCLDIRCKSPGKHPRTSNGLTGASKDPKVIQGWWQRWPDANVGVRTGAISTLLVLDVDPRHGGDDSLESLLREHGRLPDTVEAITGSGGRHILLSHPGRHIGNSSGELGSGLDIRCDGGYIVVAPSYAHRDGQAYQWEASSRPESTKLAPAPPWLIQLLTTSRSADAKASPLPEVIPEGERDRTLASLAGTMRRRGASEAAILAALREENSTRCVPSLDDDQVIKIAGSVARYSPVPGAPDGIAVWDTIVAGRFQETDGWDEDEADHVLLAMFERTGFYPVTDREEGAREEIVSAYAARSWTGLQRAIAGFETVVRGE